MAIIQVVVMWSNERYRPFLQGAQAGQITEEWFSWFLGSWKVARNLKQGCKTEVREYLDGEFRRSLLSEDSDNCVDATAQHLKQRGWSSRRCYPVSLVSKIGFFLRPDRIVPLDRFSMQGLNALRKAVGNGKVQCGSYRDYLTAFEEAYATVERPLQASLNEAWVCGMADRLKCNRTSLGSIAMRRKLFDAYLMHLGEYRP